MSDGQSSTPNSKLGVEAREARWVNALQDWDATEPACDSSADIWDLARMLMAFADAEHAGYDAMAKAVASACEQRDSARDERDVALAKVERIRVLAVGPTGYGGKWILHRRWDKKIARVVLVDDIGAALESTGNSEFPVDPLDQCRYTFPLPFPCRCDLNEGHDGSHSCGVLDGKS